ncbi:T9SS type A sorting domain-containing protein [Candidatus Fermentibacterales bacterium]|nr:T9SS type A sorting domain-containing protein [Candidatus Fermentibacterales bacterium]
MRVLTGSRSVGPLVTLTAFLLLAMSLGVASAQEVGDQIDLLVPDLSEFPDDPEVHQFTVRAETAHAFWLVQDTSFVEDSLGELIWGDRITQEEIDSLTTQFEGGGVDVWGSVTGVLGEPVDTDGEPKIWLVLADTPDYFQNASGPPSRVGRCAWVEAADIDGSGTFNNHDIVYINVGVVSNNQPLASKLRTWYIPSGLGYLIRQSVHPMEDLWIVRGLGQIAQYETYGLTYVALGPNKFGVQGNMSKYENDPYMDLTAYTSGLKANDFGANQGQEFLFFKYVEQRSSNPDVIFDIARSDTTGMLSVARAIDSSVPDSLALETNIYPLFVDWMGCNLLNDLRSDYGGGIYTYDFLEGETYQFTHRNQVASFLQTFGGYPFGVWIPVAGYGIAGAWNYGFNRFQGDWSGYPTVYFNGQYSDDLGSGLNFAGQYTALLYAVDATDILEVSEISLSEYYNGTFDLNSSATICYLGLTGNNPTGPGLCQWMLSQPQVDFDLAVALHQNYATDAFLRAYLTLVDNSGPAASPVGVDWYGPSVFLVGSDSTAFVPFSLFYGTIWQGQFEVWASGTYNLETMAFDSSGRELNETSQLSVGFAEGAGLVVEISEARVDVEPGALAPGSMASLMESDLYEAGSSAVITPAEQMTGIEAGPVSVGPSATSFSALLSFEAENARASVYRYNDGDWTRLDSYYQGGRIFAPIDGGGVFVLGTAPGVSSPELPAALVLSGNSPNPFAGETVISFGTPAAGRATLRVYDMAGRLVRTLTDGDLPAAQHSVVWDGRDQSGSEVGTGVYFCRLESAGQSISHKLVRVL